MSGVALVTDSASDLPLKLAEERQIDVVPLTIRFGDHELVDRVELSPTEFWARCASSAVLPETAAPAPGVFRAAFDQAAERDHEGVVCITLSSALSATYQSAAAAAAESPLPVRVVDSRSITMGQGLITLAGAELAARGAPLDEVAGAVERLVGQTRVYGALATLENLRKGGRIGPAAAVFGSMLSIKPIIELRGGVVEGESRQRTRRKSLEYLAEKVRRHGELQRLAVVHGNAPDLDDFLRLLGPIVGERPFLVCELGPVIGTHAGPGAIGVTFQVAD
ncbi:MAG: DegV family protein [Acidimicrobiales bacterium]|nr:DegV family protein [Acidimicrobiales bacterium]